jgi:hypothetical protein
MLRQSATSRLVFPQLKEMEVNVSMKSFCVGFDRYVQDFYHFASGQLSELNGVRPPVTRVLMIQDDKEWKRTLRFAQKLSGMTEEFAENVYGIWWFMPETLDERLALGSDVLADAWVDFDAYVALRESKFITPQGDLAGRQFYYAMSSAAIQLAAFAGMGLKGTGKVEHDPQAIELFEKFRGSQKIDDEDFLKLYGP